MKYLFWIILVVLLSTLIDRFLTVIDHEGREAYQRKVVTETPAIERCTAIGGIVVRSWNDKIVDCKVLR